jgi:hypothetical protein
LATACSAVAAGDFGVVANVLNVLSRASIEKTSGNH